LAASVIGMLLVCSPVHPAYQNIAEAAALRRLRRR
jgi:hypothetical protein